MKPYLSKEMNESNITRGLLSHSKYMPKAIYDVKDVASCFIDLANNQFIDEGVTEGITNLKLQKLLYFAQAARLVLYDSPLFKEEIEAWKFGPVIPSVYRYYKKYSNQPIPVKVSYDLPDDVKVFLRGIWDLYGKYSAAELVDMTHSHDPWKRLFYGNKGKEGLVITKASIKEYYSGCYLAQADDGKK